MDYWMGIRAGSGYEMTMAMVMVMIRLWGERRRAGKTTESILFPFSQLQFPLSRVSLACLILDGRLLFSVHISISFLFRF